MNTIENCITLPAYQVRDAVNQLNLVAASAAGTLAVHQNFVPVLTYDRKGRRVEKTYHGSQVDKYS